MFVNGKRQRNARTVGLQAKCKPAKNLGNFQEKQSYKQIFLQSLTHRVIYSPSGKIEENKRFKYTRLISQLFTNKKEIPWET